MLSLPKHLRPIYQIMELADLFAAMRWWAVLMLLGAAATPLVYTILSRLPDKGYAFVKMVGLLLVAYIFWLLVSLGFLGNNLGGVFFALLALVALSTWIYRRDQARGDRVPLRAWLYEKRRYALTVELLFALFFALWVWVRMQNPTIAATEKPMEIAFLNGVGRSATFPPLDPWLSGFAISYYYFGYVMVSLLGRLAAVPEYIGFNLGVAWLMAGAAVGAFGLVYNLIRAGKGLPAALRRHALIFGLTAAVALPLAGNMQILMEYLHGNQIGSADFWTWLDVRDINQPPTAGPPRFESAHWWWWRSSRVIHEHRLSGEPEPLEPIAEFPSFSFILGDLHPHVLALPFAFLSLVVAFCWQLTPATRPNPPPDGPAELLAPIKAYIKNKPFLWAFTALLLGGLSFLNTWDVLIHLFVVAGAFVLFRWRQEGEWRSRLLAEGVIMGGLLALAAFLLYLPFYLGFRSQAGPPFILPMLMRPTRLPHFLIIFGMPLLAILFFLVTLAIRRRGRYWQTGLFSALSLIVALTLLSLFMGWVIASSQEGAWRVESLANELGLILPSRPAEGALLAQMSWGANAAAAVAPALLAARVQWPAVTLLLAGLVGLAIMLLHNWLERRPAEAEPSPSPWPDSLPFALLLILTGALLTIGPEFVYLRDHFGVRLNTIFKFYYQAWVMFGVAALVGLSYLLRTVKSVGALAAGLYGLMLAVSLLFPYHAVQSRAAEFRGAPTAVERQPPTLNGLAHIARHNPDEYEALLWLRENVSGAPVILEAVGGQYTNYGRVSAHTGLPTLLGWAGHQNQWRGATPEPPIRDTAVSLIYRETEWDRVIDLLNRYQVEYIYVGSLERSSYGEQGLSKFERLPVAFANNSVIIYKWQPDG